MMGSLGFIAFFFLVPSRDTYHISERYAFAARQGEATVRLAVMMPKSGPYQIVSGPQLSGLGEHVVESHPEVDVIRFVGHVAAGQTNTAILNYDVILRQGAAAWEGTTKPTQQLPEPGIESVEPIIVEQTRKLVGGRTRNDAYRLFAFSAAHLSWPRGSRTNVPLSAARAYQSRVGGCGEFAHLTVALCRAAGIPARSVAGLYFPLLAPGWSKTTVWSHPAGAHAWTEVHADGKWRAADPSSASFLPGPLKRLCFGRTDGRYLAYGDAAEHDQICREMSAWARDGGKIIGAMSFPVGYAAGADQSGVSVTPEVCVRKGLWDSRWFGLLAIIVLSLAYGWHRHKGQQAPNTAGEAAGQRVHQAQPSAAPNGGPATQCGNSGVMEGPPSVN
jgi:transglutaminase-like putative cysteine protease